MIPRATYRLQFHKDFTFADAAPLAPYLASLGISHVYSSPIGTARAGSTHGYDQVDPTAINPELGGEDGFRVLAAALKAEGLGIVLDIVPNHMAVGQADNRWWLDVLKHGRASAHAELFDIDWTPADPALEGRVAAPVLGAPYAEALAGGALQLKREAGGDLSVWAYDAHRFPLRPEDQAALGDVDDLASRFDPAEPEGRARLHELLERQHYRLAWWKTAGDEINWRRFFDINELAGVKVEREEVFELIHTLPLRLYSEGLIDGVRVDHVDGLANPAAYCRRLRAALEAAERHRPAEAAPGPAYFVVEKILAQGERLSPDWLTDGTTGYDYMNEAAALLHDPAGEAALTDLWARVSGRPGAFEEEERRARLETVRRSFAGQREACVRAFHRVARSDLSTRDLTAGMIRRGLNTLLSVFPAYRSYGTGVSAPASDDALLARAVQRGSVYAAPGETSVLERIAGWLRGEGPGEPELRRTAVRRFQQLSAPVAAKAVEDTAFYRYGRLLSRDDVGSDPARLAASVADMHTANIARAANFPHAMLTTATHDHKRGEDVRARLAVLSERPAEWAQAVERWNGINASIAGGVDPLDLYPLYQTLVGAWPLGLRRDDPDGLATFRTRVSGWWRKALREAKLNSSWAAPDEAYETRCDRFLETALDGSASAAFLGDLIRFVDRIAPAGAVNGLTQTLLRCTVPGVPDLYQVAEDWDLSLVDPDNRRPVDYASRQLGLADSSSLTALLAGWRDGRLKQRVIAAALDLRRRWPEVFRDGAYTPLEVAPSMRDHVFAFTRHTGDRTVIVAAPLRIADHIAGASLTISPVFRQAVEVALPERLIGRSATDVLTGQTVDLADTLSGDHLFSSAPAALLAVE